MRVAGINLPAFVERPSAICPTRAPWTVSPGLTSRPSLSARRPSPSRAWAARVAGINLPAFVERPPTSWSGARCWSVSPGLTSRPSLSGDLVAEPVAVGLVSPGLTSRPSLSVCMHTHRGRRRPRVAGINLPAFVERRTGWATASASAPVSPGLTSRPSLSDPPRRLPGARAAGVAGINLPAFVERLRCKLFSLPPSQVSLGFHWGGLIAVAIASAADYLEAIS